MNAVYLSEQMISEVFWRRIRRLEAAFPECERAVNVIMKESREIQKKFPPDLAGSISADAVRKLWLLAKYFKPKTVVEVGTYIGRSAMAIADGATNTLIQLYTCDHSFDLFLPKITDGSEVSNIDRIQYFGKTSSSEMLSNLISQNLKNRVDWFFLDGRISDKDLDGIEVLMSAEAIFILDDFEGVEKGVLNAIKLRERFKNYLLMRPETFISQEKGLLSSNLALLYHPRLLRISRQQEFPIDSC